MLRYVLLISYTRAKLTQRAVDPKHLTAENCIKIVSSLHGVEPRANCSSSADLLRAAGSSHSVLLLTDDSIIYLASGELNRCVALRLGPGRGRSSAEQLVCSGAGDLVASAAAFVRVCLH